MGLGLSTRTKGWSLPTRAVKALVSSSVGASLNPLGPVTRTFGPLYGDAFSNELDTFHRHIVEGTKPLTDLADSRRDLALMAEIVERMRASETAGLRTEPAIQGTHSRCRQKLASASRRVRHTSPWLASYQAGSVLDQAGHRL